jgi:acyl-CoA hydrolase
MAKARASTRAGAKAKTTRTPRARAKAARLEHLPPGRVPARRVRDSAAEMVEVVLPNDTNPLGNVLGGRVMHLIDMAGAIAAHRHSRRIVVTASLDELHFLSPIRLGQLILLRSSINFVARSSMDVGVMVFSENILTGDRRHTSTAYLTFVAIDENGQPVEVPRLILETKEERRRWRDAVERRRLRLARRAKLLAKDEV